MSRKDKRFRRVMDADTSSGIRFGDLRAILRSCGFEERVRGSHHIFTKTLPGSSGPQAVEPIQDWSWREMVSHDYRYETTVRWSEDDQAFIAEVPELPGCMADGATQAEALANAKIVIAEWIETARELGRAIPRPGGVPA